MSKFSHLKVLITIVISCLIIVATIIYIKELLPSPISKSDMENEFSQNKEIFISVTKYFEKQEYTDIYITATSKKGEMLVYSDTMKGTSIHISDESIAKNISDLFEKHGFEVMIKENDGIYFQRWSNRHYGRGVVYSTNRRNLQNELITKLEPLDEENWYFYEEK